MVTTSGAEDEATAPFPVPVLVGRAGIPTPPIEIDGTAGALVLLASRLEAMESKAELAPPFPPLPPRMLETKAAIEDAGISF